MATQPLLEPLQLGALELPNRVIMAPLTRMRATPIGNVPQLMNEQYYQQRASAGLIISEATPVNPWGHGYALTPGIHSDEQEHGWKAVVDGVHRVGGRIYLQLWHVGRLSHPDLLPEQGQPVAPSALPGLGEAPTLEGMKERPMPRALTLEEVEQTIEDFRQAAIRAQRAGFDGVEIHGANGYLLEQFLSDSSNHREDRYGGSLENRARFMLEITAKVVDVWGGDRVGIRLSPANTHGNIATSNRFDTYRYVIEELNRYNLAYIHLVEPRVDGSQTVEDRHAELYASKFRPHVKGDTRIIAAGGHTRESGNEAIASGAVDAVAYGRLFISNPDLPERFSLEAPLNPYNRDTFYGGSEEGYLDYPTLEHSAR
ncbi:MAG: N-ethylmaleimide reductase [Puniceicoccaceae bacterium 5H]|nr:MAG: N-ethylmaleimide reductase [Puniceicoccaceae bacterium 5H]